MAMLRNLRNMIKAGMYPEKVMTFVEFDVQKIIYTKLKKL